jgi:hypothetical protein
MIYYILYPGNTEADTINDTNQLGESSFKTFWANRGFNILMTAVEQHHHDLNHFIIKDEQGKNYSIEEFLDKIKKLKVRIQE